MEQGAGGGNSDILQRQLEKANKELKVRRENGESWLTKECLQEAHHRVGVLEEWRSSERISAVSLSFYSGGS